MVDDFAPDQEVAEPVVKEAFAYYSGDKFDEAIAVAEKGLHDSKDPVGLRLIIALAKRRQGQQQHACKRLEEAIKIDPKRSDLWTLLGICRRDLAARESAAEAFEEALALSQENAKARYHLAVVRQEMGDLEAAVEHFEHYTKLPAGQGHALAWSLMGVAYRNLEKMAESVAAIRHAIELEPDDIPARNALVITHYLAGEHDAAIAEGQAALALKDRLATERFAALQLSALKSPVHKPFNETDRTKNIISFSLWGDDPIYTHGAIVNAQMAPNIYPSWQCRFYCDDSVPEPIRKELKRLGSDVRMIEDPGLSDLKTIWRFLVADDPKVDRFICRDTDSRLNSQEAVAVDAWIKSAKPFHLMRDHIYHMEVMLAGLWVGVTGVLPNVRELANTALGYRRNRWNDQEFLRDVIWPKIRTRACVHDSVYQFRGAGDFPPQCRLPGKIHVGGAIKRMPQWPVKNWPTTQKIE
jgi:tetratricopeptide (TPR) repeat protein